MGIRHIRHSDRCRNVMLNVMMLPCTCRECPSMQNMIDNAKNKENIRCILCTGNGTTCRSHKCPREPCLNEGRQR